MATVAEILSSKRGKYYPTLKEAFESGETFSLDSYVQGEVLGEAEFVARQAGTPIPCCACGGDVMTHPKVGWASLIVEDDDEQPTRLKGFRLCQPCAEQAKAEDQVASKDPSPHIDHLVMVEHDGDRTVAANWGVFRKDF